LFRPFQLFRALNQPDRRSCAGVEASPETLVLRHVGLGQLVSFVDEVCITNAERAVPVIWHAVVAESVYVIHLQPMVVNGEKIIARELAIKVGALAEVAEVVLSERSHERVLAIVEPRISVEISEVHTRVAIDDIVNDGDSVLMSNIDHLPEVRSLAEPFGYAEISDRQIAPAH